MPHDVIDKVRQSSESSHKFNKLCLSLIFCEESAVLVFLLLSSVHNTSSYPYDYIFHLPSSSMRYYT